MVWFQCEDCGENLKKPKLLIHFNRCSAYKLSCIDCGVVFDQQSVQAHSSCVSEAEKYGPKGLNKGATGSASNKKTGKVPNGSDVDFSRGLSTFPPWSCSLCNVKATSQETLELHAQGKKHQSRSKAAAAKEKKETQERETDASADLKTDASKDVVGVETEEIQVTVALDSSSLSTEKKRKKERTGEGDDLTSPPSSEKKVKREAFAVLGTSSTADKEDEMLTDSGKDSQDKKRKLVEEHLEINLEENRQLAGKKSRKKGKLAPGEVNGHRNGTPEVSGSSGVVAKDGNGEQVKKNEKKGSHKDVLGSPLGNGPLTDNKGQTSAEVDISKSSDTPRKVQQDDVCKLSKKEKKKKNELVHEMSFREWLGEADGTEAGTSTHPPHDIYRRKELLEQFEGVEKAKQARKSKSDSIQDGMAKVVKWKKIIREVLGKLIQSLNGKLKKKDLKRAVLPLAQKAIESASISVDRKALKAELMRQVTSSPKFVMDGKHIMLAPKI